MQVFVFVDVYWAVVSLRFKPFVVPAVSAIFGKMPKSGHGTPTARRPRNRTESDLRGYLSRRFRESGLRPTEEWQWSGNVQTDWLGWLIVTMIIDDDQWKWGFWVMWDEGDDETWIGRFHNSLCETHTNISNKQLQKATMFFWNIQQLLNLLFSSKRSFRNNFLQKKQL